MKKLATFWGFCWSDNSFVDEAHRITYTTVINANEREAAYVIDGLMHNDVGYLGTFGKNATKKFKDSLSFISQVPF